MICERCKKDANGTEGYYLIDSSGSGGMWVCQNCRLELDKERFGSDEVTR